VSTLDERLIIDGVLLTPAENESRDNVVDDLSVFPDEKLPPVKRLSNDYIKNEFLSRS
jgi:hypothetical protein